mgnify:CR=1 FL=1
MKRGVDHGLERVQGTTSDNMKQHRRHNVGKNEKKINIKVTMGDKTTTLPEERKKRLI